MAVHVTDPTVRADRRTSRRFSGPALPWLTVSTARSSVAEIIDVSDAGALIQTPTRLKPGEREVVLLSGRDTIKVVGWAERVEITRLVPNVSYRTAFRFAVPIELKVLGLVPPIPARRDEGDACGAGVLTGASRELVERFASWVRDLSGVHAIRVASDSAAHPGTEPVHFAVPASSFGNGRTLQVFFSAGAVPSKEEFARLRRLALLASDLPDLDVAPPRVCGRPGSYDGLRGI